MRCTKFPQEESSDESTQKKWPDITQMTVLCGCAVKLKKKLHVFREDQVAGMRSDELS